jgi:hypothetical protein
MEARSPYAAGRVTTPLDPPPEAFEGEWDGDKRRVPPHDEHAEQALAGSALLGKPLTLPSSHFFVEKYRRVVETVRAVDPVNVVTVASKLRELGALASLGGSGFLIEAMNAVPSLSPRDIASYEAIVSDFARRRAVRDAAARVVAHVDAGGKLDGYDLYVVASAGENGPGGGLTCVGPSAWDPLPQPDYLVNGIFIRGSVVLLAAFGSSFKTWLAQALCLAVSTGSPWLGRECKQAQARLIDFEAGDYEIRRRMHRIARGRVYPTPIPAFDFVTMPRLTLTDDAFFTALETMAKGVGLIVIDSLAAGSGGIDENDARFARPIQRLKSIAVATGCVIVIIHHNRKSSKDGKDDIRELVRGTSAIFNAADVVFGLTLQKNGSLLYASKFRGGPSPPSISVRIEDVGEGTTIELAKEDFAEAKAEDEYETLRRAKAAYILLLARAKDLRSVEAIAKCAPAGVKKTQIVRLALRELQSEGIVTIHEGCYRLKSELTQ